MVQNLWWAAGYNVVAIPLAAGALAAYGILLSDAIIQEFWSRAGGSKDQLAIVKQAVEAKGSGTDGKDLAKVWSDFGVKVWNRTPKRHFHELDKISSRPAISISSSTTPRCEPWRSSTA